MARYHSYRGRSHRGVTVLVALLFLLVLAAAAVFVLPDYLVYTENGVRLELPFWGRSPSPPPSPSAGVSVMLEVVSPEPSPSPSPSSPSPSPEPPVRALFVPLKTLENANELRTLREFALAAGVNTLVVELKDEKGALPEDGTVREAVNALSAPGLTLAAGLSAFLDNTITRAKAVYGVKYISGDVNWIDRNENRWINPYNEEGRQYVLDCVDKAGELGFQAVFLDNVCFPYSGALSKINYGTGATSSHLSAMNGFLDELAERAAGLTLFGVVLEETLTSGQHMEAGQSLEKFREIFDRLFCFCPDDAKDLPEGALPVFSAESAELRERLSLAGDRGFLVKSSAGEYPPGAFEQ